MGPVETLTITDNYTVHPRDRYTPQRKMGCEIQQHGQKRALRFRASGRTYQDAIDALRKCGRGYDLDAVVQRTVKVYV